MLTLSSGRSQLKTLQMVLFLDRKTKQHVTLRFSKFSQFVLTGAPTGAHTDAALLRRQLDAMDEEAGAPPGTPNQHTSSCIQTDMLIWGSGERRRPPAGGGGSAQRLDGGRGRAGRARGRLAGGAEDDERRCIPLGPKSSYQPECFCMSWCANFEVRRRQQRRSGPAG